MSSEDPLLSVRGLRTSFRTDRGKVQAIDGLDFDIHEGETFGLVGESGAGKSVTALSIMGLIADPGRIEAGEIWYQGENLVGLSHEELRDIRGNEISMIFQDPMTALNPGYTIGEQIQDVILIHTDLSEAEARSRTIELLEDVGIPAPEDRVDDYPHQFSGGMRQRALIAMALSCNPDLLIADEPTTALDVTIQSQILDLISDLQREYNTSVLLITHDMGVVAQICERVGVMYAGEKVEEGPVEEIFNSPRHPYTVGLMKSIPRIDDPRRRLDVIEGSMPDLAAVPRGCSFRDRCPHAIEECAATNPPLEQVNENHESACLRIDEIDFEAESRISAANERARKAIESEPIIAADGLRKYFTPESEGWLDRILEGRKYVHAVDDVSFSIRRGETLGLVGESGCGKTTLGRTLLRLYEPDGGTVLFSGDDFTGLDRRELKASRSDLQIVFQDPFSSLNPRRTIKSIIGRPLKIHKQVESDERVEDRVVELLNRVGLDGSHLDRYPHEFSGGQKQRVGIARALAVDPDFIVLDEPVSALDASVQAQIINLLMDLQEERDLTYLFIAHDLNVVQHISDRIAVMYLGELVEVGEVAEVFEPPYHPYTEALLSSIPRPEPGTKHADDRRELEGEIPSPIDPPSGCRFHTRCPYAMPECETVDPEDVTIADGHVINCHLFDKEFMDQKPDRSRPDQSHVGD